MPRHTSEQIEEIRRHLSRLDRGNETARELARAIGVSTWTIHSWKRRYGAGSPVPASGRHAARPRADLIEVEQPLACDAIEIIVGAMTIRVPPRFGADELRRVLEVVRAC